MKYSLIAILIMASVTSCSKSVDNPVSEDSYKKNIPASKTLVYSYNYSGICNDLFSIDFPAFDAAKGTLTSWQLTMSRKVSGTLTLINDLNAKNDSAIDVVRYTLLTYTSGIAQETLTLPDEIVNSIPQKIGANRTLTVPVHVNVNDEFNSTAEDLANLSGISGSVVTWNFRDLIEVFKPNCGNSFSLKDSIFITLKYTYKPTL